MGRAPAVAEEPIALFRCQKGNGCPAFFCSIMYLLSTQHTFVFSIHLKRYLMGAGGHLRAAIGLMHKHPISVCRLSVSKGSREPLTWASHSCVFWSRPIRFSVRRRLQEEGMGREGMHFPLCAAASLLWQPEKRNFLSFPRPSTPCSLLIIFG